MFPLGLIDIISKVVPSLGSTIGNLISSKLGGVDMSNLDEVAKALELPESKEKLKELELQLNDLQNARATAAKESPVPRLLLALLAHIALVGDIFAIQYVTDGFLNQILLIMLVFLVWDIRQIYKFYFGSSGDLPSFSFLKKK